MLDKRYQVFITTSGQEMLPERVVITQTLIGMGFFSWGLEQRTPVTTAFARRQIDDCDYVLLLLGSQYGEQSVSGISYMHLEYIYAVTKQKPIIVYMHDQPDTRDESLQENNPERKQRFLNFRQQLIDEVEQIVRFKSLKDLESAIRSRMPQMLERYPVVGWVRPQSLQAKQDEIDQLRAQLAQAKKGQIHTQNDPFLSLPKVYLKDQFSFDYRMNAYLDGNYKEIICTKSIRWDDLVKVLDQQFKQASPEDYFSKVLNQYLTEHGLVDAQKQLPQAHAVSKAQINVRALHIIKQQLRQNEWIVPVGRDERQRMLWKTINKIELDK